jgi:DNA-binding transcriptional regulator YiaG
MSPPEFSLTPASTGGRDHSRLSVFLILDFLILSSWPERSMRAAAKWVQPEHYQVVGAALVAARQRANMTQVELARRLGKPQSIVSGYENGKRRVDLVEFVLIVRTLGADPVGVFTEIMRLLPE